jgi:glycosyltransferase involved in cell wall biosynthesis
VPDCIARHPNRSDVQRASIIVPARNAACHIGRCLDALQRSGSPLEIIVVDDASTDATATIAAAKGVRVVRLSSQRGPGAARNAGVMRASLADIVIFVDADVEVAPGSLAAMLAFLEARPEYAAVFGSYDDNPGGPSLVSKYRDLIFHYRHQTGRTEADTLWCGFGAARREPFLSVGGFAVSQEDRIEDIEFGARLRAANHRIALRPELQCKHHKHWTLRSMIAIDLFKRALPWSRLLFERNCWADDLNLRRDRRLAVALAGLAPLGLVASLFEPLLILLALGAWAGALLIERDFFRFLWGKSRALTLAALPLHVVHLSTAAVGFALASLEHIVRRSLAGFSSARRLIPIPALQRSGK